MVERFPQFGPRFCCKGSKGSSWISSSMFYGLITRNLHLYLFQKSPVWEITGAGFSRSGSHTAGASTTQEGISIRFPRITRQRPDKTWREATDVPRLEALLSASHSQPDWSRWLDVIARPSNQMASRDTLKRTLEGEDENSRMKGSVNATRIGLLTIDQLNWCVEQLLEIFLRSLSFQWITLETLHVWLTCALTGK